MDDQREEMARLIRESVRLAEKYGKGDPEAERLAAEARRVLAEAEAETIAKEEPRGRP